MMYLMKIYIFLLILIKLENFLKIQVYESLIILNFYIIGLKL